jgi:hypothetical protein
MGPRRQSRGCWRFLRTDELPPQRAIEDFLRLLNTPHAAPTYQTVALHVLEAAPYQAGRNDPYPWATAGSTRNTAATLKQRWWNKDSRPVGANDDLDRSLSREVKGSTNRHKARAIR